MTYEYRKLEWGVVRRTVGEADCWEHCDSPTDESPHHFTGRAYDERCGWCYLGASHTEDAHKAKVSFADR